MAVLARTGPGARAWRRADLFSERGWPVFSDAAHTLRIAGTSTGDKVAWEIAHRALHPAQSSELARMGLAACATAQMPSFGGVPLHELGAWARRPLRDLWHAHFQQPRFVRTNHLSR